MKEKSIRVSLESMREKSTKITPLFTRSRKCCNLIDYELENTMKRMLLIFALMGLGAWAQAATCPNIVWIFSDDHSFQTIGAERG